jgi:hypothetical protein
VSDLKRNGFLSPEMSAITRRIRSSQDQLFSLADDVNRCCHAAIFQTQANRENKQQLLVYCLLGRAMTTYQAIVLVVERGMPAESSVLLRVLLEVFFRIAAIAKNVNIVATYVDNDLIQRKISLGKLEEIQHTEKPKLDPSELVRMRAQLDHEIQESGVKGKTTEWYATQAGHRDLYLSAYTVLSDSVHVSARNLLGAFETDPEGYLVRLKYGPSDESSDDTLLTAIEFMLLSLNEASRVLAIDLQSDREALYVRFTKLCDEVEEKAQ